MRSWNRASYVTTFTFTTPFPQRTGGKEVLSPVEGGNRLSVSGSTLVPEGTTYILTKFDLNVKTYFHFSANRLFSVGILYFLKEILIEKAGRGGFT